ncbi:diaminopimelate decarboxylase-like [Ylistrum balloti]|uniref:diaminopimelate decarboxylase-like n=1 Tax=Ylistrum balloti TaxID=509963 RepID=UPI00290588E6|nr:diaminopimelate decarboxylase-like [Ylistrum balloti]
MTIWQDPWLPSGFTRHHGNLFCEQIPVSKLVAQFGTPLYVYSASHIEEQIQKLHQAFASTNMLCCYAVKANDNLGILKLCKNLGTGFDVVSGGELERVLSIGADPKTVVFSGVGKTETELLKAARLGICSINIESTAEAELIMRLAKQYDVVFNVSIRVNPDVDPQTHPKIATGLAGSKFGIDIQTTRKLYQRLLQAKNIHISGIAFHIGSQLLSHQPIISALKRVQLLVTELQQEHINISHIDIGGGFGIQYTVEQQPLDIRLLAQDVLTELTSFTGNLLLEPGRWLVGNAGILCTTVLYTKTTASGKQLLIVDAAMNDLLRPALYDAHHDVAPMTVKDTNECLAVDLVGPVCESSDVLASQVKLPPQVPNDILTLLSTGAYGSVMSGTYNTRPRPTEILVKNNQFVVLRHRETMDSLLQRDQHQLNWQPLSS